MSRSPKTSGANSSAVELLMDTAAADSELLYQLDRKGDRFGIPRKVDFHFVARAKGKAEVFRDFVNDHQYGVATVSRSGRTYAIRVELTMPIEQNIICSVSGFMACVADLFGLEYDGWGCVVQKRA